MNRDIVKGKIILASGSPRRREILTDLQIPFEVDIPSHFDEIKPDGHTAEELALHNATGKAEAIAERHPNNLVLGVDTVGDFQGTILEKPKDREDAARMLRLMQGQTHQVLSGVCLIHAATGRKKTAIEITHITFAPLTEKEIQNYLDRAEVMDKAAAYAIQGLASLFVTKVEGDYFNVVGLPVQRLFQMLKIFDINLLGDVK